MCEFCYNFIAVYKCRMYYNQVFEMVFIIYLVSMRSLVMSPL